MPSPPSFQKVNPADFPILFLTLSSQTLPLSQVNEYADTTIGQRLSMVRGVAQVNVFGAQKHAVRIDVDPHELAARAIGIDEVASAIRRRQREPADRHAVRGRPDVHGQDRRPAARRGRVPAAHGGVSQRKAHPLDQVARVYDGVENDKTASWYNDARTVYLAIQRQPGTNTVQIVDAIRRLLPSLRAQLPAAVQLTPRSDRSQSIRESVHDVKFTLGLTVVLVVLVIFLFLRNVSATIIPSLALPFSIVGTFAVMYAASTTASTTSR